MLTPREKSPIPENFPRGGSNPRRCGQRAQTLPTSYSSPYTIISVSVFGLIVGVSITNLEIWQGELEEKVSSVRKLSVCEIDAIISIFYY